MVFAGAPDQISVAAQRDLLTLPLSGRVDGSIGRYRETEPIIDPGSGVTLKNLPIDASIEVTLDQAPVQANGAVELGRVLAASQKTQQCFATQWLRFTAGRHEEESDACVLSDVASSLSQGASLLDALKRVVLAPEFRLRKLGAP